MTVIGQRHDVYPSGKRSWYATDRHQARVRPQNIEWPWEPSALAGRRMCYEQHVTSSDTGGHGRCRGPLCWVPQALGPGTDCVCPSPSSPGHHSQLMSAGVVSAGSSLTFLSSFPCRNVLVRADATAQSRAETSSSAAPAASHERRQKEHERPAEVHTMT